jgi:uncharacterized protein
MKIFVKAKPNAKQNKLTRIESPQLTLDGIGERRETIYKAEVKEPPIDGKSNMAIIKLLAEYFDISIYEIKLISGQASKQKIFEIPD